MKKVLGVFGLSLLAAPALAWNTETVDRVFKGCGMNSYGEDICIEVPVKQVGTGNGSSHKAWIVGQNTGGFYTIDGVPQTSGKLTCHATGGGANGTLLVKATTAHKAGGGTWGIVGKKAELNCIGKGADFIAKP